MAKIIISRDAEVVQEVELSKERMTIGRHPHNDIVLDHRAVSGTHAVLTTILKDAFLEDLGSTNGTFVKSHKVGKHMLANHDRITIAVFQIEFVAGPRAGGGPSTITPPGPQTVTPQVPAAPVLAPQGRVEVMNGPNAGKQLALSKPLTTLGRPRVSIVVISRRADGYSIAHIEGDTIPTLDGAPLGVQPVVLRDGGLIDVAGTQMTFRQP